MLVKLIFRDKQDLKIEKLRYLDNKELEKYFEKNKDEKKQFYDHELTRN